MKRIHFGLGNRLAGMAAVAALSVLLALHGLAADGPPAASDAGAGDLWAASAVALGGTPAAMGKDAAAKLKDACKGRKPDLVLLFDFRFLITTPEAKKAVLDAVAEDFDRKVIYGSSIHGPQMTESSPNGGVGVLAVGGIRTTAAKVAPEKGKQEAAYATLAESLKVPYAEGAGKGRLVLIFGACVPPTNGDKIVDAFTQALGKDVPIFGSPAPDEGVQYFQGEMLTNQLMAILITGDFTCRFAMANASPSRKGDQAQDPDKIVESAGDVMKAALGDNKDNAALVLVTHCFTRAHSLERAAEKHKTARADEYKAIVQAVKAPLFGVMDDIEIGRPATGEPAVARVDQISVCVIAQPKK